MHAALLHAWTHVVGGGVADEDLDLAACALLIAELERPGLDAPAYLRRLGELAAGARPRPGESWLDGVRRHLFRELGFRGNAADYYDPANSCLDQVLDRRLGIPITLSLVVLEVGRRVGLAAEGVGFPGHFLVRVRDAAGEHLVDAFDGGAELDRPALQALLERALGPQATLSPDHLRAASRREILGRMLGNLHRIYRQRGAAAKLAQVEALLAVLAPTARRPGGGAPN